MTDDYLAPLVTALKSGDESFHAGGIPLPFTLLRFWQWSASDLTSNALRGRLAEFLVASALGIVDGVRAEWDAYDLRTADGINIEVKSAAYIQTWQQRRLSTIQFDIAPTRYWDSTTNCYDPNSRRQADVYVFAFLAHQENCSIDPLNLDQWRFFVLATPVLNRLMPYQKQIRLARLREIGSCECAFDELKDVVTTVAGRRENSSQGDK
jgi:hypothetical protein